MKPRNPIPIPWATRFRIAADYLDGDAPKVIAHRYGIASVQRVGRVIRNFGLPTVYPKIFPPNALKKNDARVRKVVQARQQSQPQARVMQ